MNYFKETNKIFLKSIVKWKHFNIILAFSLLVFNSFSCNKNDAIDQYYVKYEVSSSTIYYGGKLDVTIRTENNADNTIVVSQRTKWETIIGPVNKGFNANLKVVAQGNTNNQLSINAAIYVSKNDSPFALKVIDDSDVKRDSLQLSYTIDY